ncbi:hypothetical protein B0H11DRAFT_1917718 [Mycena galericulata]|nr:hypothetical protein B0H11DRAFT_1917718 [Mycena galericulata]
MSLKVAVTVFVPLVAVSALLPLPRSISAMVPMDAYKGFAGASVYPPEEQDQQEFPSKCMNARSHCILLKMPNHRPYIRTPQTVSASKFLKARLYPAVGRRSFVPVHVLCPRSNPQQDRYPCVESVMDSANIQAFIHDVPVTVLRQLPTGRVILSVFRCYFKRHKRLPHNHALNLKGDVLVMRVAAKNFFSVMNMRGSD